MNIKMCVSNLDLFAGESVEQAAEGLLGGKCSGKVMGNYEKNYKATINGNVEEVHCLGYCYWCPQSLMALVDGTLVRDYKNHK
ncbi:DUF1450 domain-containing protein [Paenibacillus sp. LMG 31456]|uniref:DUF1450 domain-containing protein n=1 Tax=Paenibacillus foliorum TaxID=2654974 RepID=A0A972GUD3_9BACL|nr:DUF1450 domain-containing protein [Paenibacillus foliorum]NOU93992.1 DUF1450 domain-containing protein [Paenibacillus foliorum]